MPDDMGEEPIVAEEPAPKRRGRKPGSKNKPREATVSEPKRRGRPPRVAGGSVRSVPVTADIVSDALDKMARATSALPAPTGARTMFATDAAVTIPVKRGRGRPRKVVPDGGFPPKVPEWIAWAASATDDEATGDTVDDFIDLDEDDAPIADAPIAERSPARRDGLRAGLRWTRRLRGIAAVARPKRARNA